MEKGFLISLEGLDGASKTTVCHYLEDKMDIHHTKEPSHSWSGNWAKQCIESEETHPLTDTFSLLLDRTNHYFGEVQQHLERGETVVCDRYADSTRAYQPIILDGHVPDPESFIEDCMKPWLVEPDLTLWIDIKPETAVERSGDESYENIEMLEQVRENYRELVSKYDRIKRVDGERSKEDVCEGCLNLVRIFKEDNEF